MIYNCKIKEYKNGLKQFYFYNNPVLIGRSSSTKNNLSSLTLNDYQIALNKKHSLSRSKNNIYDIARSSNWDYFITLTLNNDFVDRFNYSECTDIIIKFTRWLRRYNFLYLIVPEQHKNGAWHFHGLIFNGDKSIYNKFLTRAVGPYGAELFTNSGLPIYNFCDKVFKFGFTSATPVLDCSRVSSYISKYITKSFAVPKGKKRYWCSRSIERPKEIVCTVDNDFINYVSNASHYHKEVKNDFNTVNFFESNEIYNNYFSNYLDIVKEFIYETNKQIKNEKEFYMYCCGLDFTIKQCQLCFC